jgi:hypothetical protein
VRRRARQRGMLQAESVHAFVRGDFPTAELHAVAAFESAVGSYSESWAVSIFAALLIPVRHTQGRLGELWDLILDRVEAQPEFTSWHALACAIADARGDDAAVADLLHVLRERKLNLVEDTTWTAIATMVCTPIWRARDDDLAGALYERLSPFSGQMSWNGLNTHGPIDGGLALLSATLGDRDRVAAHLEIARGLVESIGAPHLWWPQFDQLSNT